MTPDTCLSVGCERQRIQPTPSGTIHAHCDECERRLTHQAFGSDKPTGTKRATDRKD